MSAFKASVDVEYSVYSVPEPVALKKKSKSVSLSHKEPAPAAATQSRIARAAPGLRPPEHRPVSAGVLASAGRGRGHVDIGSKAKAIDLAVANERGAAAASQAEQSFPGKSGAPARVSAAPLVPRQSVAPVRTSEPALSRNVSATANGMGSQGEFGTGASSSSSSSSPGHGPNLPLPKRSTGPAPSRRPIPPGRRFQLEQQKQEAAVLSGNRPLNPDWNWDPRAPDRALLMLEQDDVIHKLKFGDGMPLLSTGSAVASSADGVRGPLGEDGEEEGEGEGNNKASGVISSRTPRDVTPADIYAPHRIRSTKNASGPVVNGRDKSLFHIAKLAARKAAEPSSRKSPERVRRGGSPNRGSPSGAAAPIAPTGRARHKQHEDHDNIRNHVIHGNDAVQGHMGIHISEEQQNLDVMKRPHGIHSSPWNFSELMLDVMLADERLLPAPVNRMIPMFDHKAATAGLALPREGKAPPDFARSSGGSASQRNGNVSNEKMGLPNAGVSAPTAIPAVLAYKKDVIHKEKSLSKIPDISFKAPPAKRAAQ